MGQTADQAARATEQIEDAAKDGDLALVRKLLDDGANVEGPDDSWTTPLFWACRKGYDDVERYVINLADDTGATPLDYALRFPAPDHETPTDNGALEYLLDDHLPVFWKRLYALTFARLDHAVLCDEYLARHLGSFLVGDDLLK